MTKRWFVGKVEGFGSQLLRYGLSGGIAFALDFFLLVLLTEVFQLYYLLSGAVAFLGGMLCKYLLSIRWVFARRSVSDRRIEFLLFGLVGILGMGLSLLFLKLLTEVVGLHYAFSKVFAMGVVFLFGFGLRKALLF